MRLRKSAVQALDYYPYGGRRINAGTDVSRREFAGTEYDASTNLNYMMARYYSPVRGQFMSEDPLFLELGGNTQKYGRALGNLLANPQELNSYSYALDNPLRYRDPNGLCPICAYFVTVGIGAGIGDVGGLTGQYILNVNADIANGRGFASVFPNSEPGEYSAAFKHGVITGAAFAARPVVAALTAGGSSLAVDYLTPNRTVDPVQAIKSGTTAFVSSAVFAPFKVPATASLGAQARHMGGQQTVNTALDVTVPNRAISTPYNATLSSISATISAIRAQLEQIQRTLNTIKGVDNVKRNAA